MDKLWGRTDELLAGPMCEVHRIDIEYGGYCSWHRHTKKANAFIILKGELEVDIARDRPDPVNEWPSQVKTVSLCKGDFINIPSGVFHRFRARISHVEAFEIYYPDHLGPEDIDRLDTGGKV